MFGTGNKGERSTVLETDKYADIHTYHIYILPISFASRRNTGQFLWTSVSLSVCGTA